MHAPLVRGTKVLIMLRGGNHRIIVIEAGEGRHVFSLEKRIRFTLYGYGPVYLTTVLDSGWLPAVAAVAGAVDARKCLPHEPCPKWLSLAPTH